MQEGDRFGRLILVREDGGTDYWFCVCDCGSTAAEPKRIRKDHLRGGKIVSCGCHKDELSARRLTVHGECSGRSPEYRSWRAMHARCGAKAGISYKNYVSRGITVCDRWSTYEPFLLDMGRMPGEKHSIDRIDCNRGYEPGNCRWATRSEQARNVRTARMLTVNGKTMGMADWADEVKSTSSRIFARLALGWSDEDAVLLPIHARRKV